MQRYQKGIANKQGFTIVELLIVIVVIAILAAVSIVAYNGIQARTQNATVKSDLATFAKKLELYRVDSATGAYPISNAQLDTMNIVITLGSYYAPTDRANFYYCIDTNNPTQYAMGAITKSKQGYFMVNGKITETTGDATAIVWGSTTCTEAGLTQGNPGILSSVGYDNTTGLWAAWVK